MNIEYNVEELFLTAGNQVVNPHKYENSINKIKKFSQKRKREFILGRECAERSIELLVGKKIPLIGILDDGQPDWPEDIIGSISHSNDFAAAVVGSSQKYKFIGIDIMYSKLKISDDLRKRIYMKKELELIERQVKTDIQIFTEKEAIKKGLYGKVHFNNFNEIDTLNLKKYSLTMKNYSLKNLEIAICYGKK